jgi:hypothetical protein
MTSTVTTATVSTLASAFFASLALIVAVVLVFLLVKKEFLTASSHPVAASLRRALNAAVVPLVMAFGMIAFISVLQVMN